MQAEPHNLEDVEHIVHIVAHELALTKPKSTTPDNLEPWEKAPKLS